MYLSVRQLLTVILALERHTVAVASGRLQGWHPDPFGLHEMRYFSVGNPTKLVRNGRVEGYDEPPGDPAESAAPAADTAIDTPVVSDAISAPATSAAVGTSTATASAAVGVPAASGAMIAPAAAAPAGGATRVMTATPVDSAASSAQTERIAIPQRRGRHWEYAAVAAGAVVAVVVFVALGGGSASKPGIAPAAFVTRAAQRTLAKSTAEVTLSGTATMNGQTITIGGTGQVDLANNASSFKLGATIAGGSITETEVEVGGNLYAQVAVNGHGLALSGGRHWIEVPVTQSRSRGLITGSPASSLALLSQQGARVTPLGTSKIGGRTCNGYSVTPTEQAMMSTEQRELAKLGFSAGTESAMLNGLQGVSPPTITVWFDQTSQLACQLTIYTQFGTPTSTASGGLQAIMTFTYYGTPVKITPPAASDTVSLQQFLTTKHA
jgi:hypothetical protein